MSMQDLSKIKEKVRRLPHSPGVYLMKDRLGKIIYVGKAKDLKKRVSSYFQSSRRFRYEQPKVASMIEHICDFDRVEVNSETEAIILESKLIKHWKPKYNKEQVDDKRFPLIQIDMDRPLPRLRITRFKKNDRAVYFGPFPDSRLLSRTMIQMRKRFGILLGDAKPKQLSDKTWTLYDDARAEIYGHPNQVSEEDYKGRIRSACIFLEGKSREWLEELRNQMRDAADEKAFEKAAELRDIIFALEKTLSKNRKFICEPLKLQAFDSEPILQELHSILSLPSLPKHIECFDISHISGSHCVASMVHFTNGLPDKNNYRRYRIKTFTGNDDFRAMEEVVRRRYRRLHKEGRYFPELVVIDGGKGQVNAALNAFFYEKIDPPPIIGLAKKKEMIIFPDNRAPLNLPLHNESLKLLQRIRDEAHRFANTFNAEIRSQRIKETILDDFEGLGPVKRQALLKHFKNFKHLISANIDELREVEGIGLQTAQRLQAYLSQKSSNTS